jgi:methyl-accepting chemotaxis protein
MFDQMKLGVRAAVGIGVIVLLSLVVGVFNTSKIRDVDDSYTLLWDQNALPAVAIGEYRVAVNRAHADVILGATTDDAAKRADYARRVRERIQEADAAFEKADKYIKIPEVREQIEATRKPFQTWRAGVLAAADELSRAHSDALVKSAESGALAHDKEAMFEGNKKLIDVLLTRGQKRSDDNTVQTNAAISLTRGILAAIALFGAGLAWLMMKSVDKEIGRTKDEANRLAEAAIAGQLDERGDPNKVSPEFRPILVGFNQVLDSVINPLNVAAEYVDKISKGDIPPKITDSYHGDFNTIKNNLNGCIDAVNALVADANYLSQAAVQGRLATRADAQKHQGDFRKIVDGVNKTLDAVINPLNVAAKYVERISAGDIPPKITDSYNGDFNEIKNNLNTCIDAVNALTSDANLLAQAAVAGKLATRADASKHGGDFRRIVDGVNNTLDAVIGPLNVAAKYVERISAGDIPPKITDNYNGDFNEIKNNLNKCIDAVNALVADANVLAQAAIDGRLETRADASKHGGDFRKIVDGVNKTLDAVIGPLNVAAKYVEMISAGNIPAKITDRYNGDFNTIKNNLNTCIDAVNALVADANVLATAAVQGKLATRADASKHGGDFRKIVDGVNKTLDAVIGPLNVAAKYVERISAGDIPPKITDNYNGDFNEIKNNLNKCIDAVNALVADANLLAQAAVAGKLSTRADASRHGGDFRKIVDGVNKTLDNVVTPIKDIGRVLERMSASDMTARVTSDYQGDFETLKVAANKATDQLRRAIEQITQNTLMLASSSEELSRVSEQMSANAEETSSQANVVSAASEQVNKNVQTVATSTEEMSSSVKEIAKNATEASRVASSAVRLAETTNETISKLGVSSAEIGQVIKVITSIAQQTNLLALNATIEAARAGEAGKGFAVVANEVKELAKETAKATEDISQKIEAIQGDTKSAVDAIAQIGAVIKQINDIQSSIAGAVEEQSATTASIERNVSEAAKATGEIAQNITGVAQAAANTAQGSGNTQQAAVSLSKVSSDLQAVVSQFRI